MIVIKFNRKSVLLITTLLIFLLVGVVSAAETNDTVSSVAMEDNALEIASVSQNNSSELNLQQDNNLNLEMNDEGVVNSPSSSEKSFNDLQDGIKSDNVSGESSNFAINSNYTYVDMSGFIDKQLSATYANGISTSSDVYVDYEHGNDSYSGANWSAAVKTISKAMTIAQDNAIIYLAEGTHIVDTQITIGKTVTIIGNGTKTFITNNGKGNVIFSITKKANDVSIYNCTFANNIVSKENGLISNAGKNVTIKYSTFINNTAKNGGAIYSKGVNFTICDSIFIKNTANGGGAIFGEKEENFIANNCTFINNSATSNYGGAIRCDNCKNVLINNCTFTGNDANNGGAIRSDICKNVLINNCTFTDNAAINNAGAIMIEESNVSIKGSEFNNNSAKKGTAIYNGESSTINLNNNIYSSIDSDKTDIYNEGTILSPVTLIVLGNQTITAEYGQQVTLFGNIITEDGASVVGQKLSFTINGNNYSAASSDNGNYTYDYTISSMGKHLVTANYACAKDVNVKTGSLVVKNCTELDVYVNDIVVGQNATITVYVIPSVTGNVTITVNNKNKTVNLINSKATLNISGLASGNYDVIVTYNGDDSHFKNTTNTTFKVSKVSDYVMNVTDLDIKVGENATINVTLPKDANGKVIIYVGGVNYSTFAKDGVASINVTDLTVGGYIVATYEGNDKYAPNYAIGVVRVSKVSDYDISVVVPSDIRVGENITITVVLPKDATGEVILSVNGANYTGKVEYGVADVVIPGLPEGVYNVTVNYTGDNKYTANQTAGEIAVSKVSDYDMDVVVPSDIRVGENITITVVLPKDATGEVILSINGTNYSAKVKNGTAYITIPSLPEGDYDISVNYAGDDKYDPIEVNKTVVVALNDVILSVDDVVMIYHDGSCLKATLLDAKGNPIANAIISFTINGITYNRTTNAHGVASMAINLVYGMYDAVISYVGNANYSSASANATVTVNSSIIGDDLVKMWMNDTQFYATFIGYGGKLLANTNVTFNINGVVYTRQTNASGVVKLNINLNPGKYTLTAYNPVSGEERGFNVTVKSLIETSDLTKYYNNASNFEAEIYNKDGSLAANKTVTFNINGVLYTRLADENGIVRLNITLRPGDYIITSMYEGLSIENNVKVIPTLETADLSMKYGDGSNFTVKALDGQGNPLANQNINFNIGGVFYTKTTGDDGIANLGINLNKGEYIITSYWDDYQVGNNIKIA